ncbi:MAG: GDP-mannose 4,6-dehydratase [Dehalococcoidia bacterium]|nr:GDP-mannose 4,6-dehydratase [Chloroflexota bacterium]MCK4243141.1 GDP-mannose 4,6-dehydratase [Dehalococcoidia bacterium]
MKKTVLVTGAAGFIGSHLVERLLSMGHQVVGVDNFDGSYSPTIKWANICTIRDRDGFLLVEGDIRDAPLLDRVFSENDIGVVVHLAARAGVRPSLEQPLLYQDINIRGTLNLLEASRAFGVEQFLFASSSSVYGLNGKAPFNEEAKVSYPISPYAASKAAAELYCRTYSYLYHLPVVVLRLFTVYGPRQRPEMAIHRFVKRVDQEEEVTIFGNGTAKRDYTYIDDIVVGFEAALAHQEEAFSIFNLGRGKAVDLRHLLRVIEEALGKKARIKNLAPQPGEVSITLADISKAQALLGYQPRVSIEEGVPLFVQWYVDNRRREDEGSSSH